MAAIETVSTSLNGNFKNVYGDKIMDLVPETDILYRNDRIKFVSKKGREGLQFNQPVLVALPSSATWGLNGPTLNSPIAMQMANATVTGSAITMRDVLSYDSAARAATSEAAFEGTVGLVLRTLFKAHAKFAEIDLLYGNGSITSAGTTATPSLCQSASSTQAGGAGTNVTITVTYGTWAPAMFSGFQNAVLDAYNAGAKVNTNAGLQIVSVNVVPASNSVGGTIVLTGNATDLNALQALSGTTLDYYWYGAYGNNMVGIKGILANTGSLFGINAATYDLWQSNSFDCGSTQATFSKLQQAVALAVSRGLDEDVLTLCAPVTFADLVNEQAGARRYDSSYDNKKGEQGVEALSYWGPSGKIEVVPHMFVHQGEAFIVPPKELIKVGPLDHISPTLPGIDGDIFFQSPTQASYEVRLFSDFGLLANMPAKCTYVKNITNSVSA
jgi:hypothetical protein